MKKISFLFLFLFNICFLFFSKELTIKVFDNDIDIPLEKVKIQITNTNQTVYTDKNGVAKVVIKDNEQKIIIQTSLIGYETKKMIIKDFTKELIIKLSIQGVLEGKQLVIEEKAIGKTDEELGVSTVVNNEEMKSSAEIGLVEDVLSTIKTLPGVGFTGMFDSDLSIRGGNPEELTCEYDGFMIRFPYHWGGAYSIFNPNMVESVKFSTGIFSANHGYAMSGLLEVFSENPTNGFKFQTLISSTTYEMLLEVPLGKSNSGLMIGGRLSYWDLPFFIIDTLKNNGITDEDGLRYTPRPYIRDGYLKWFWKPHKRFEWFIDGFFASDGAGMLFNQRAGSYSTTDINTIFNYIYYNYDALGFTGFKILPTDSILINIRAGYEFWANGFDMKWSEDGTKKYSDDFKDYYEDSPYSSIQPLTSNKFKINNLESKHSYQVSLHSIQTKLDTDFTLHEKVLLSTGGGLIFDIVNYNASGNSYTIDWENGRPVYKKEKYKTDAENSKILKSFLYFNFAFNVIPEMFKIEVGSRLDHFVFYGKDDYHVNTYPVPGPRLNITFTPIKNLKYLNSLTFSAGVGLFSKIPFSEISLSKETGIGDFQVPAPKLLAVVLGTELDFPLGFKFKVEGYYKYYFNRLYMNYYINSSGENKYKLHADGIGHIAGFEVFLQRKISRYVDGWISYSFVYTRLFNPETDGLRDPPSEPRNEWYYPQYHRFHHLAVVLNIKPINWFTISTKMSFATGKPLRKYGDAEPFAAFIENDGETSVVEMWTREETYDDNLRANSRFVLDVKFLFHFYFPKSKVNFEAYIAFEDILSIVLDRYNISYRTDRYTGEETRNYGEGFSLGFPIPSLGIKLNF